MALPRFDKRRDEPGATEPIEAPASLLILEGWCLGARPQADAALLSPVNRLEAEEDPDGRWRRFVNAQLKAGYRSLFSRVDMLVFLAAPAFDVVADWRIEQERANGGPMRDADVRRFVEHFRRITDHMLQTMPREAAVTIALDRRRGPVAVHAAHGAPRC